MNRCLIACIAFAAVAGAQDQEPQKQKKATAPVITKHESVIGGKRIAYTATTGMMALRSEAKKGEQTAEIFYMAYVKDGANPATRPITFVFNGGPGSASIWLHMGAVGPRMAAMTDKGEPFAPPGRFVDNPESWLDLSDLVFIDPVGTGYSRPAEGHKQSEFSGLKEDTQSVGEFIRRYVTQYKRWRSPKFLCGESYGTTRAASLAGHLQDRYGMFLNGIVLVSSVLNFQTIRFSTGNDLPYVLFLPTYATTAWYHGRVKGDFKTLRKEVEEFAINTYLSALAKGDALPKEERRAVIEQLMKFTGLSRKFLSENNLRIPMGRFNKELLRKTNRTVGRLDSRIKGIDRDAGGSRYEYDPSMAAIDGPYSAAFKDYVRTVLKYESDIQYRTLGGVGRWKYPEGRYVNVAETLRSAMSKNRHLKVLVTSGYFDLATPYFATDYTVRHLGLDESLRANITVRYYEAGHMMYIHAPSRTKMKSDVAAFFREAVAAAVRTR